MSMWSTLGQLESYSKIFFPRSGREMHFPVSQTTSPPLHSGRIRTQGTKKQRSETYREGPGSVQELILVNHKAISISPH